MLTAKEFDSALMTADAITRIQIELLSSDEYRWTLFDGQRCIVSTIGDAGDLRTVITSSEMLVKVMLGLPPTSRRTAHHWN